MQTLKEKMLKRQERTLCLYLALYLHSRLRSKQGQGIFAIVARRYRSTSVPIFNLRLYYATHSV